VKKKSGAGNIRPSALVMLPAKGYTALEVAVNCHAYSQDLTSQRGGIARTKTYALGASNTLCGYDPS